MIRSDGVSASVENSLSQAMTNLSCTSESKDERIRNLENLVAQLNSRISELETENDRVTKENQRLTKKANEDRKLAKLSNEFLCAKGNRHAALHAIFNLTHTNKIEELKRWATTGSIHTRDGLLHWKLTAFF